MEKLKSSLAVNGNHGGVHGSYYNTLENRREIVRRDNS